MHIVFYGLPVGKMYVQLYADLGKENYKNIRAQKFKKINR